MKFFKVCAAVLAISGVVYNSAYGMDAQPLAHQGEARGGAVEAKGHIVGVVRAMLRMVFNGQNGVIDKVLQLYKETGEITEDADRTLTFNVEEIGSTYSIKIIGENGLVNESAINGFHWTMKAEHGDAKIGVNIQLTPNGDNGGPIDIENQDPIDFQDDWQNGEWKIMVIPQPLSPDTVVDTYKGTAVIKIEANS